MGGTRLRKARRSGAESSRGEFSRNARAKPCRHINRIKPAGLWMRPGRNGDADLHDRLARIALADVAEQQEGVVPIRGYYERQPGKEFRSGFRLEYAFENLCFHICRAEDHAYRAGMARVA